MNPIFWGGNDDLVDSVLQAITTDSFLPEDTIMKQGEEGDNLYFLSRGDCEVLVDDEDLEVHRVDILSAGSMFGEIALISNCKRTATVRTLNYCTWATLTQQKVTELIRKFPEVLSKLKARRSEYNDWWKMFLRKLITSVDYFKRCKPNTIEELVYSLRQEYVEANKVLFKTGDSMEKIRFISHGTVQIIIRWDDGQEILIDNLRQGCSLGLYSILEPSPITFQIKAKTHLTLQCLDYDTLEQFRKNFPELDREITNYESYIDMFGPPICDYSIPYRCSLKTKFKNAVRRAITFNEYKYKKKSKLSKLIVELKRQKEEWLAKGEKKAKREEFKQELASLIYDKIKDIVPNK